MLFVAVCIIKEMRCGIILLHGVRKRMRTACGKGDERREGCGTDGVHETGVLFSDSVSVLSC